MNPMHSYHINVIRRLGDNRLNIFSKANKLHSLTNP